MGLLYFCMYILRQGQCDLEIKLLLLWPPKGWDHKHVSPCMTMLLIISVKIHLSIRKSLQTFMWTPPPPSLDSTWENPNSCFLSVLHSPAFL